MAKVAVCKDCLAEGYYKYRPANFPGNRCATHHRAVLKARKADRAEKRVQKVYGLLPGQYDEIYKAQGGKCAICLRATGATKRLSVDHDHKTDKVRGLLCGPCNKLLGHCRDSIQMLQRAINYLEYPPASILDKHKNV